MNKTQGKNIMKKNLLTIGLLANIFVFGQSTLCHVDDTALFYVGKGALVYNGGGLKVKGTGIYENHGNVMVVGSSTDKFQTVTTSGADAVENDIYGGATVGKFINKLNEPTAFAAPNTTAQGDVYTYGQLYISGLPQSSITGFVRQEHANVNHGLQGTSFQQFAIPFYNKTASTLGTDLGKTFDNTRWKLNDITKWNNTTDVFDAFSTSNKTTDPTGYYILGNKNVDFNQIHTIIGQPYADGLTAVKFDGSGSGVASFGANGTAINGYNERYDTYLQDGFQYQLDGKAWGPNYGRNVYMYGNPYLTNMDLRGLFDDTTTPLKLSNIQGIRVESAAGVVNYQPNVGGSITNMRYITLDASNNMTPVGDVNWLIIRPLSVFLVKLKSATAGLTANFDNLRRFNYIPRTPATTYNVTAARMAPSSTSTMSMAKMASANLLKTASSSSTVKQLGVIALDASGNELGRTYYVVTPTAITGHSDSAYLQVSGASSNAIGSYEELPVTGGYDNNYTSNYWLYINEANEVDFAGKPIPGVVYDTNVKSLKFEIRENAQLIADGQKLLSSNKSFYYQLPNGNVTPIAQNQVVQVTVPVDALEASFYYDAPKSVTGGNDGTLATESVKPTSRTMVVFNPEVDNYIIRFDPDWKKADIKIYDISGKLVLSANGYNTANDYTINLPKENRVYIIIVISDNGKKVNKKIIR